MVPSFIRVSNEGILYFLREKKRLGSKLLTRWPLCYILDGQAIVWSFVLLTYILLYSFIGFSCQGLGWSTRRAILAH